MMRLFDSGLGSVGRKGFLVTLLLERKKRSERYFPHAHVCKMRRKNTGVQGLLGNDKGLIFRDLLHAGLEKKQLLHAQLHLLRCVLRGWKKTTTARAAPSPTVRTAGLEQVAAVAVAVAWGTARRALGRRPVDVDA